MTDGTPASGSDNYALGRSSAETDRLITQHQLYGPFTRQFLVAAGVTAGMKVLDLGRVPETLRFCWLIWSARRDASSASIRTRKS